MEGTELITIDYEGMYCDEALKAIAEKAGTAGYLTERIPGEGPRARHPQ